MEEIWKDIKDYEDRYQVSNKGRVRSLIDGHGKKRSDPLIKSQYISKVGYYALCLNKEGNKKTTHTHRLIAEAFIPNPENKPQVINGIKTDNRIKNLEWVTDSENKLHAHKNGLHTYEHRIGEKHPRSILTKLNVLDIKNAYNLGCFTQKEIADAYGVSRSTISKITNDINWSHI